MGFVTLKSVFYQVGGTLSGKRMGEMGNKPPECQHWDCCAIFGLHVNNQKGIFFFSAEDHVTPHFGAVQGLNCQRTRANCNWPNKYSLVYSLWKASTRNRVWLQTPDIHWSHYWQLQGLQVHNLLEKPFLPSLIGKLMILADKESFF